MKLMHFYVSSLYFKTLSTALPTLSYLKEHHSFARTILSKMHTTRAQLLNLLAFDPILQHYVFSLNMFYIDLRLHSLIQKVYVPPYLSY